jgi:hypothetical protein
MTSYYGMSDERFAQLIVRNGAQLIESDQYQRTVTYRTEYGARLDAVKVNGTYDVAIKDAS